VRFAKLKRQLKAAAYSAGGVHWEKLFHHLDRDNGGLLDFEEFRRGIRKSGKMRALDLSDEMLARMFDSVDVDASGYIDISEFTAWLAFSAARSPRFAHARTANARVSSPASPGREALSPRVVHTRRPPNTDPAHSSRTRGLVAGNESKTAFEEKDEEQRGRGELLARARRGKHRGSVESEAGETAGEQSEPERRLNSSRENQRTAGGEESDPEQLDQPYVGDRSAEEDNISGNLQAEENFDDDADRQSKDEGEEEVREGEAIDSVGQRRRGRHQVRAHEDIQSPDLGERGEEDAAREERELDEASAREEGQLQDDEVARAEPGRAIDPRDAQASLDEFDVAGDGGRSRKSSRERRGRKPARARERASKSPSSAGPDSGMVSLPGEESLKRAPL